MTKINIQSPGGGGGTPLPEGNLQIKDGLPIDATLQTVSDQSANDSALQISTDKVKAESSEQCPLEVESTGTGGGIALLDNTTTDNESVGIGAFGDLLCLRGGGNPAGTMQLSNSTIDCQSNELVNFIPRSLNVTTNLNITSANFTTYLSAVIKVTGAITITVDNTVVDDFNVSIVQMDANQCTFAAGGTLTLQNRQGHTQTAGQWATTTLYVTGTNLILAGDTA
jgi:hypothetical protein